MFHKPEFLFNKDISLLYDIMPAEYSHTRKSMFTVENVSMSFFVLSPLDVTERKEWKSHLTAFFMNVKYASTGEKKCARQKKPDLKIQSPITKTICFLQTKLRKVIDNNFLTRSFRV